MCGVCVCVSLVFAERRLVMFADSDGADRAVRELNGTELDNRKIFLRKVWVSCAVDCYLFVPSDSPPSLPPLPSSLSSVCVVHALN